MANSNKKPYVTSIERARIAEEQDRQAKALLEALRLKHDADRLRLYTGQGLTKEQANQRIAQENEQRLAELESEEFEQDLETEQDQDKFDNDEDESDVDSLAECESEYEAVRAILAAENAKKKSFNNDPNAANRFRQADNCSELWQAVDTIPANIALIPLVDKRPTFKRTLGGNIKDWTKTVAGADNKKEIKQHITGTLSLKKAASHKAHTSRGDYYNLYVSGFGIVTGDASDGTFAIDVDGESANVWLEALSNGDLPHTVEFTSGKLGRRQLLYRVPNHLRGEFKERLAIFTNKSIGEFKDIPPAIGAELPSKYQDYHCSKNNGRFTEALDIRYNKKQSALPPSRHPTTGRYTWINSFQDTSVADMPQWLINLVTHWLDDIEKEADKVAKSKKNRTEKLELLKTQKQNGTLATQTFDDIDSALAATYIILGRDGVFNWAGHNWKEERSNGWTHGDCPNHESSSGTAFAILDDSGGWKCHGCDASGNIVQYRAWRDTKNARPEGAEWLKYATELFKQAGVRLKSNHKRWEDGEISHEEYLERKLQRKPTQEEIVELAQYQEAKNEAELLEIDKFYKTQQINRNLVTKYYECNERFLSDETFSQFPNLLELETAKRGHILGLKSPKGTGKSRRIKQLIQQAKDEKWRVISVTVRINLGMAQGKEWGIGWVDEGGMETFFQGNSNTMSCCWDSLHKFYKANYGNKPVLLILDEVESGLDHYSTAETIKKKGNRAAIYAQFRRLMQHITEHGGLVVAADADLSETSIDYLRTLGNLPVTVIDNSFVEKKEEVMVFNTKEGQVRNAIRAAIEFQLDFLVATDSIKEAETLHAFAMRYLNEINANHLAEKMWLVDSKTSKNPKTKARLSNINQAIRSEQPVAIFYTPTINVGISIDVDHFAQGFGIFKGAVIPDVARQMIARNRKTIKWTMFADNTSQKHLMGERTITDPKLLKSDWIDKLHDQNELTSLIQQQLLREGKEDNFEARSKAQLELAYKLKHDRASLDTAEFHLLAHITAKKNFQMKHYHKCFVRGMESEGWIVTSKTGAKTGFCDELKELRDQIVKQESEDIAASDCSHIVDYDHAKQILKDSDDKAERDAAYKYSVAHWCKIDPDVVDAELVVLVKYNPRWLAGVKFEAYLKEPEIVKTIDAKRMNKLAKDSVEHGQIALKDSEGNATQVDEIIKFGLLDVVDLDDDEQIFCKDTFQPLLDNIKHLHKKQMLEWGVKAGLSFKARKTPLDNPIGAVIKPMLAKMGYDLVNAKKDSKGVQWYRIPAEQINCPHRAKVLQALFQEWAESQAPQAFEGTGAMVSNIKNTSIATVLNTESIEQITA